MKKINLRGVSEILSEKELKNVMGGSGSGSGLLYCSCTNCTNPPYRSSWQAYYSTASDAENDINKICCGSGGSCHS